MKNPLLLILAIAAFAWFILRKAGTGVSTAQTAGAKPTSVFDQITKAVGGADKKVATNKGPNPSTKSKLQSQLEQAGLNALLTGANKAYNSITTGRNGVIQVPATTSPVYNYQTGVYEFGQARPGDNTAGVDPGSVYQFGQVDPTDANSYLTYTPPTDTYNEPDFNNPDWFLN